MSSLRYIDKIPSGDLKHLPEKVLPFMWFFVRQMKGRFSLIIGISFLAGILFNLNGYLFGQVVQAFTHSADRATIWDHAGRPIMLYAALILFAVPVLYNTSGWLQAHTMSPFANMVRRQLAYYLGHHSYRFFQDDFAGRLAGKVMEMPYAIRQIMSDFINVMLYAGVSFFTAFFLFLSVGSFFAWLIVFYLGISIANLIYFVPRISEISTESSRRRSAMRGRYIDILTNILTVKLFARRHHEDAQFRGLLARNAESIIEQELKVTALYRAQHIANTGFMLALLYLTVEGWQNDGLTIAQVTMVLPVSLTIMQATFWLCETLTGFFERIGEVKEGMEALIKPHDVQDAAGAAPLAVTQPDIVFDNVAFEYPSRPMFDNFSLVIPARQRIGLIGPSGAGKSTFVQLLLRLHDLKDGAIRIDGHNIAAVAQDSLRENIAVIPQMSDLMHRSIRDNIRYGRLDATDDEVMEAAKRAHAHDFIVGLTDGQGRYGYDSMVGERGVKLSGGQRQRIAIARAILKDAPILVLDEATSSLDSESEKAIQESLEDLMANRTVIAIAHRLSTIAHLDRLIVMDNGRIVEDGTHDELLARGGLYARLWALQSGGFLQDHV